jgi:hypothetical protein
MVSLRTRMREPSQDQELTLESMEPVVARATHLPNTQRTHTHTVSNATQQTSAIARPARARHAGSPRSASHGCTISFKPDRSNQAEFACMHARNDSTPVTSARVERGEVHDASARRSPLCLVALPCFPARSRAEPLQKPYPALETLPHRPCCPMACP